MRCIEELHVLVKLVHGANHGGASMDDWTMKRLEARGLAEWRRILPHQPIHETNGVWNATDKGRNFIAAICQIMSYMGDK